MKSKKTNKANLESRKPAFLMMGLVLSFGIILESFEWATGDFSEKEIASSILDESAPEVVQEVQFFKPPEPREVRSDRTRDDIVEVLEKDEEIPPTPIVPDERDDMPDVDWGDIDGPENSEGPFMDPPEIDKLFTVVETMPQYPGGDAELYAFLGDNIKYPENSRLADSEGKAYISFTIEIDGSITDIKAVGGDADFLCKKEAQRVIGKMPNWKPGKQRGKVVRVSYTLPIHFKIGG